MRTDEKRPNSIDSAAIDRLIDGEMSDTERRELLLQLETEPDGWRSCALAFLEDQAWRKALVGVVPANEKSSRFEPAQQAPRPARNRNSWLWRVPIAASLIASTFAAGFGAGGLAKSKPLLEVAKPEIPGRSAKNPVTPPAPLDEQVREVGTIDLVDASAGEAPTRRIPIVSGPGLDDRWLRNQPSSVPDYVRARWEREGFQVQERRRVVSVILADGRKVSIPVDEVALDYVGQNPL
jgi:hypothetical protein